MELKYPNDLVSDVMQRWSKLPRASVSSPTLPEGKLAGRNIFLRGVESSLPAVDILKEIFGVIYHVSFQTEESRKLAVTVAYLTPEDWKNKNADERFLHAVHLEFPIPKPFMIDELVRLAPALNPSTSMILLRPSTSSESRLEIWGITNSGADWWKLRAGRKSSGLIPPRCLTVSSSSPGSIKVSFGHDLLFWLEKGREVQVPLWSFSQGHIGLFFHNAADNLYRDTISALGITSFSEDADEDDVPRRLLRPVFENIVRFAVERCHGAAFIIVPDRIKSTDLRLNESINIKYPVVENLGIWDELVKGGINYKKYFTVPASERNQRERWNWPTEKILELEEFVATLSSVDGAVVLTDHCRLLGFGGEIIVSPDKQPKTVRIAHNPEAAKLPLDEKRVDAFGTRHRSAFRFCSAFEDCIALVVSQDGPAKAVRKIEQDVVMWNCNFVRPE